MRQYILLIDNDEVSRETLTLILDGEYTIGKAYDKEKVLKILEDNISCIAAVIFNITANGNDGMDFFKTIVRDKRLYGVPIIASVFNSEEEMAALSLGAADCIKQPYIGSVVELRVRKAVDMYRSMVNRVDRQSRAVISGIESGIAEFVIEGGQIRNIYANNQYYRMFGYTEQQFSSEVIYPTELIYPEDKDSVMKKIMEVQLSGKPVSAKYRFVSRDKSVIWVKNTLSVVSSDNNEMVMLGVFTDITDEKTYEQKLRENDEQIKSLRRSLIQIIDKMPEGCVRIKIFSNGEGVVRYANKSLYRMYGLPDSEHRIDNIISAITMVHEDDMDFVREILANMYYTHTCKSFKFRMKCYNGKYMMVYAKGCPDIDENGDALANVYLSDISDQISTDMQRKELLRDLPCAAGIYEIDNNQIITHFLNKRFLEIAGLEAGSLPDITKITAIEENDRSSLIKSLRSAVSLGRRCECDIHIKSIDGYCLYHVIGCVIKQHDNRSLLYATYTQLSGSEQSFSEMMPVALKPVMDVSSDILFIKDANFVYTGCSSSFARMIGYSDKSLVIGKTDYELFNKGRATRYREEDTRLFLGSNASVDCLERVVSYDGSNHYLRISKFTLNDSNGRTIGIYGIGHDITESREAYTQLKLLTDSIPGGISMFEISSAGIKTLYMSDGIYRMTGYPKEEYDKLAQDDIFFCIDADGKQSLQNQIAEFVNNGVPINCTYKITVKDGNTRWINIVGRASESVKGGIIINAVFLDITEQKNASISIEASYRAMHMASKLGGISFWIYNIDNGIAKDEIFRADMLEDGSIEGMPDIYDIAPEDHEEYLRMYENLKNGSDRSECTIRMINHNTGKYEWKRIAYSSLYDGEIKTRNVVGFAMNADAEQENRLRYERELQLRQELIKNSVFYYQINLTTGLYEEYYSKYNDIKGMHSGALANCEIRRNILKNTAPEDAERVKNTIFRSALKEAYKRGETNKTIVYRRIIPGRGFCWIETRCSIIERPDTNETIAFIHGRDIDTERKDQLAIEMIMSDELEYVSILDINTGKAHFAQISCNIDNMAVHQSFDYEENLKRVMNMGVLEEDIETIERNLHIECLVKALEKEDFVKINYRMKDENERIYRKLVRAFYLDDTKREIVLIMRDITDLYEEEMRQKNILRQAIEEANTANRSKSDFLSHVSHDMRTPLNAVLSFSSKNMLNGATEDKMREYLEKIHISGKYLLGIINDVLDMSKIEQKKIILNKELYRHNEFVNTMNNIIGELCKPKSIEFIIESKETEEYAVIVDMVRFNQIFINLLSNSVKFTPENGRIELIIERIDSLDKKVIKKRYTVRDNGIGMSTEFLPHAFDSFMQEYRKERPKNIQGTGLGLSIVKELVEMMNGTISVTSELGVGTVFIVELPLEVALTKYSEEEEKKGKDNFDLTGLRILLAEDNDINAEIAVSLLETKGCTVECAWDGAETVEKYMQSPEYFYDAVLMDIRMPVMNGHEAAKTIRASKRTDSGEIPIIAMTADAFNEDEMSSRAAGMNYHIGKPIDPEQLYAALYVCTRR